MFPNSYFPSYSSGSVVVTAPTGGSLFRQIQSQAGGSLLFDTNADEATYIDREGNETSLLALIGDAKSIERPGSSGKTKVTTRECTVWNYTHAVYSGVGTPQLNATVSIDGEIWSVAAIAAKSENFWRMTLEKTGQRFKTREQFFN